MSKAELDLQTGSCLIAARVPLISKFNTAKLAEAKHDTMGQTDMQEGTAPLNEQSRDMYTLQRVMSQVCCSDQHKVGNGRINKFEIRPAGIAGCQPEGVQPFDRLQAGLPPCTQIAVHPQPTPCATPPAGRLCCVD